MLLHCGDHLIDLSNPVVMGILNVTPDSFSDAGRFADLSSAIDHATEMIEAGAAIIDVGGESTRPGAVPVDVGEELSRVIPVIEAIAARHHDVVLSIDTSKPQVMRAAVTAGAQLINDVRGFTAPGALQAAADTSAALCLMHMQGQPSNMQIAPYYQEVVSEVALFLQARVRVCTQAGIAPNRLLIDPGIGFGKSLEHNLALLAHLPRLQRLGLPLLLGVSRKGLIGAVLDRPVDQRLPGGLALATAAVLAGAKIIRTHDVGATYDAVRMAQALLQAGYTAQH